MVGSNKFSISIIFSLIFSPIFLAFLDATSDTLNQGDMLNNNTFLVSSNKKFTLGFFTTKASPNSYLGIWFTNSPETPVWVANRNSPIQNNSGVLTLTNASNLMITQNGTNPFELYVSQANRTNITATLLDSGNFVVRSEQVVLWESFDYPTNTLLPGMKLGVNHRTGQNWSLTSWFAEYQPASGPFSLEWDPTGAALVVRRRGVAYWTSGALRNQTFEFMAKPDAMGLNYVFSTVTNADEGYFSYSLMTQYPTPEYHIAMSGWLLDYKGDLYDVDRTIAVVSFCYGFELAPIGGGEEFEGGCEVWEQPKCRNRNQTFDLWSGYFSVVGQGDAVQSLDDSNQSLSLSDCRDKCWNDCDCVGYSSSDGYGSGCLFWRGNLVFNHDYSGAMVTKYVLIFDNLKKRKKKWIWIVTAVIVALVLVLLFSLLCFLRRRKMKLRGNEEKVLLELMTPNGYMNLDEVEHDGNKGDDLTVFSFASMMDATSSFSAHCKLGEGGFGPVYKGKLPEGREIAIKRLSRSSEQGLVEFKNELILIAKLQHTNLVRLLGCCIQGDEKMLVYEYMPNKSLDSFLFDRARKEQLAWDRRLNIIEGISQGLLYLHKYSRLMIIHRDLKASNILLDENMNPKISDFGMARIYKQNVSEANTDRVVGTYGYMAPEYAMGGTFSVKSDVFSFGVLMLEILSGRKNNSFNAIEGPLSLVAFAWELWNKDEALELMDPTLRGSCNEEQFLRCIHVGLLCVEDRAIDRPTMSEVVSMLTNASMCG